MELSPVETFVVTVVLMGVGVFVLMACSAFLGYAAAQFQVEQRKAQVERQQWYLLGLISLWFAGALATSTAGLISFGLVLPFALLPIVGGTLLSFTLKLTELIRLIPTHWLISLQLYRVAGGLFIFPYLTGGILTRGFALNAGVGDMLTGVFALPIAWLVLRGGARYKWAFYAWTVFGILDLIVAPASAAYFGFATSGAQPGFPVTTIPLFFGPPFGILIHVVTARNFYLRHSFGGSSTGAFSKVPGTTEARKAQR